MNSSKKKHTRNGKLTLSYSELNKLNSSFVQTGIKWLAMLCGIWAEVKSVNDGVLTLHIIYPEQNAQLNKSLLIIRILFKSKQLTFIDELDKLRLITFKDKGSAGSFKILADHKNEDSITDKDNGKSFGDTKVKVWDYVYSKEELLDIISASK